MDNLGGLFASALAGIAIAIGAIALVIGLTIGYVVGSPDDVIKQETKVVKQGELKKASSTRINFDLSK